MSNALPPNYRFVELTDEEYGHHWNQWGPSIFQNNSTMLNVRSTLSEEERERLRPLSKNLSQLFHLNLAVFRGDEFCGWSSGDQYNHETFYMRNSAILPAHRNQGLYTGLLHEMMKRVQALGFQIILSRHTTTNNAIIIPKLKAGFVITALEVSERFGTLVHLSYYFNEKRRQALEFRAGDLVPSRELSQALNLTVGNDEAQQSRQSTKPTLS